MGNAINWNRPRYRLAGKVIESRDGNVSDALARAGLAPAAPKPRIPKAELRAETERLVAEFRRRKGHTDPSSNGGISV